MPLIAWGLVAGLVLVSGGFASGVAVGGNLGRVALLGGVGYLIWRETR